MHLYTVRLTVPFSNCFEYFTIQRADKITEYALYTLFNYRVCTVHIVKLRSFPVHLVYLQSVHCKHCSITECAQYTYLNYGVFTAVHIVQLQSMHSTHS